MTMRERFQPDLRDNLVHLRPLADDDWPALFEAGSDPWIWEHHPATERWQEYRFRRFFDASIACGSAMLISDSRTGEVIGTSRFDVERAQKDEAEIGWTFLIRSRWGGGYNASVKRLMIAHVLKTFESAIFLIGRDNIRSRRAIEKIGAVLTDRVVVAQVEDRVVDHVVYAIDRQAFARGPLAAPGATA